MTSKGLDAQRQRTIGLNQNLSTTKAVLWLTQNDKARYSVSGFVIQKFHYWKHFKLVLSLLENQDMCGKHGGNDAIPVAASDVLGDLAGGGILLLYVGIQFLTIMWTRLAATARQCKMLQSPA